MVFKANPGFCFHDSRGFESGGALELYRVKAFIEGRSKQERMRDRVHAIWCVRLPNSSPLTVILGRRYCIPVDDDRPFTAAEDQFFGTGGGKDNNAALQPTVPIIAVFTKFDARDDEAFITLKEQGISLEEARRRAPVRARADFEREYSSLLYDKPYPPKGHTCLRGTLPISIIKFLV